MRFFFEDNLHWPRVPTLRSCPEANLEDARTHFTRAAHILGAVASIVAYEEWRNHAAGGEVCTAAVVFDYGSDDVADPSVEEQTSTYSLYLAMKVEQLASRSLIALTMTSEPPEIRVVHLGPQGRLLDERPDLRAGIDAAMGEDDTYDKRGSERASFDDV